MILNSISLQHFRSYKKAEFSFASGVTAIVGPNTAGKTNLIEAIFFLATGKSFRTDKDIYIVQEGAQVGRVKGIVGELDALTQLEVVISSGVVASEDSSIYPRQMKKYLVNGIPRRRVDFSGIFHSVLFSPSDLDIITAGPSQRRALLDDVLEQVDREYRQALSIYTKALRQRNALLELRKDGRSVPEKQFAYWNEMLVQNGSIITAKRKEFIAFLNEQSKNLIRFSLVYDKSVISESRLEQYRQAEQGAGVTLVGPQRDEILLYLSPDKEAKVYGSRGQQRLVVLQLKLLQIAFFEKKIQERPVLLLDDIFSELDEGHIKLVLDIMGKQQTILTTTHKEFLDFKHVSAIDMIELIKR